MHENVPVRFGRGRLDSLEIKGLAAYLIISLVENPGHLMSYAKRSPFAGRNRWDEATLITGSASGTREGIAWPSRSARKHDAR